jgi:hypothetical protein
LTLGVIPLSYFLLPLLHLSGFVYRRDDFSRALGFLLIAWTLGFIAGYGVSLFLVYLSTDNLGFEIAAWRQPKYVTGLDSLMQNIISTSIRFTEQFYSVFQTKLAYFIIAISILAHILQNNRQYSIAAIILSGSMALALYVITLPIGIEIPPRSTIALFVGVLTFLFLIPNMNAKLKILFSVAALFLFYSYCQVNYRNVDWYRTVTQTYHDELVRAAPLPPHRYEGLIVVWRSLDDIERAIRSEYRLTPRYMENLSEPNRVGPAALEAGFGKFLVCPGRKRWFCKRQLESIKDRSCGSNTGLFCVRGVTKGNYLVLDLNRVGLCHDGGCPKANFEPDP